MKTLFIIFLVLFLSGCGLFQSKPELPKVVDREVPVKCHINVPEKPSTPLQDASPTENLFDKVKKALAEVEYRKAYEIKMEAALKSCNDAP